MTDHPSRLVLERASVDDLPASRAHEVSAHVRDCEECARYVAELASARDARLAAVPAPEFVARVEARRDRAVPLRSRRIARIGASTATLVAAAAALLFLVRRPPQGDVDEDGGSRGDPSGVALKGAGFTVYRSRDGQSHALTTAETIRGGDALRIVVTKSEAGPVAAWFVDARGHIDRADPAGIVALPAGESALPGSAIVDAPCVDLDVVVVIGAPPSLPLLEQRMATAIDAGASQNGGETWLPRGALRRHLRCE